MNSRTYSNNIRHNRLSRDIMELHAGGQKARRLLFPHGWRPELASYVVPMNKAVSAWFVERNLVTDTFSRRVVEEERGDMYGGYPFSWASYDKCTVVTKFVVLWILFDDVVTENKADYWGRFELSIQDYDSALRGGDLPGRADPFFRAWHELFESMAHTMSQNWRDRLTDLFIQWLKSTVRERETYAPLLAQGALPDLDTYVDIRAVTVGMQPTFPLVEFAQGFEVPEEARRCEQLAGLHELGTRLAFISNDLSSLEKDIAAGWPNVVTVIQRQYEIELREALEHVIQIHNDCVSAYVDVERSLPQFGPSIDPLFQHYLSRLHLVIRGLAEWGARAERYQWKHRLSDERQITIGSFSDAFET